MNEVLRRVILVFSLCLAVALLRTANFGTFYEVTKVDKSTFDYSIRHDWSLKKEEKLELLELPLRELLAKRNKTPLQLLDNQEWESFFSDLGHAFSFGFVRNDWRAGIRRFVSNLSALWLEAEDTPLPTLPVQLFIKNTSFVPIALSSKPDVIYGVRRFEVEPEDYESFTGFTTRTPPTAMLYPYRLHALAIAVFGLLLYVFIPWTKHPPESVHTKRWQVVMLDFASLLLFLPFFALGSYLAGPIPSGMNSGWILASVLWLMCFGGLFLFKQGMFYALFYMKTDKDGLRVRSYQGEFKVPYSDIEQVQGATLKNPRWLITLLSIAAIFGRGSQSVFAGGQALVLGSTTYPGLAFKLKNGGTIYLWSSGHSPSMSTFKHIDGFKLGLEKEGVPFQEKAVEVYGIGTEPRFDKAAGIVTKSGVRRPFMLLLAAPVAATVLVYIFASIF